MNECPCSRPTEGYLCPVCTQSLAKNLAAVVWMLGELHTTECMLDVVNRASLGGPVDENPLPLNLAAMYAQARIRESVEALVIRGRLIHGAHSFTYEPSTVVLASHAQSYVPDIAFDPHGPVLANDLAYSMGKAQDVIDNHPARVLKGVCQIVGCEALIYAAQDATTALCMTCGASWDVTELMQASLNPYGQHGDDAILTPLQCVQQINADETRAQTGRVLLIDTLWTWAKRHKLLAKDFDQQGRGQYRLGDVRDLWNRTKQRKQKETK